MKRAGFLKGGEGEGVVGIKSEQQDFETQEGLVDFARRKAEEITPGINEYRLSSDEKYWYFPVIEQFFEREPIVDTSLIKKMKTGGRLLSVGVGSADLEHLLYRGFNLSKDAITLADIEISPKVLVSDLEKITFDMREEWPEFAQKFDYILFPESFGVADFVSMKDFASKSVQRFFKNTREMSNLVRSGNAPEIWDERWDFVKLLIEMYLPWMIKKYHTIFCAVNALEEGGELRFSGHLMSDDELTYVAMKLKEDFGKKIEITFEPYLKIKLHRLC